MPTGGLCTRTAGPTTSFGPRCLRCADAVNALLRRTSIPVFGVGNLDPAGQGIALTLPRLDGLVAPDAQESDSHLGANREASSGRSDLYQRRYAHWAPLLERTLNREVMKLWQVVRRHGEGLVQEAFLERDSLAPTGNGQSGAILKCRHANIPGCFRGTEAVLENHV